MICDICHEDCGGNEEGTHFVFFTHDCQNMACCWMCRDTILGREVDK